MDDGTARSVITARQVVQAAATYDWLTSLHRGLYWVELTPEIGHAVVAGWHPSWGAGGVRRLGPAGAAVGSGLHAYGGMPYAVLPSLEVALVDASTGQITNGVAHTDTDHSYGDLARFGGELLCVREDDSADQLVSIDLLSTPYPPGVVRATDGFLASPRLHADRLAWVQWDKDVMPWDSSAVWVASYRSGRLVGAPVQIAGGTHESAIEPQWGNDGSLYFMSDRTGWWNLYRWRDGHTEAVTAMEAECATAPWESSYADYVLLPHGRIGVRVQHGPHHRLVVMEPAGQMTQIDLPYTSIKPHLAAVGDRIALIGASPTRTQEIALVTTDGSDRVEVIRPGFDHSSPVTLSVPQVLRVRSGDADVTVLLYPPAGDVGPAPLIVRPHAGPTYHSELRLDWQVQFFTSRGFAVADVDYRGSTGYGRAFRKALDDNWGRLDVQDCRTVADYLLATGRALPGAVFISGASAGGYTALRAVCEEGPFSLAVARSAIVDPRRWTTTAPRFQRPHAAILAHDDAAVLPGQVRRPVLLIHGDRDEVAPVEDVARLAAALDGRGLLVGMLTLEGVGHSMSGPAALTAALDTELDTYLTVLSKAGLSLPN